MNAAKVKIINVHVIPIFADLRNSFWEFIDMNLIIMCGIPKYPSPQPKPEIIS